VGGWNCLLAGASLGGLLRGAVARVGRLLRGALALERLVFICRCWRCRDLPGNVGYDPGAAKSWSYPLLRVVALELVGVELNVLFVLRSFFVRSAHPICRGPAL